MQTGQEPTGDLAWYVIRTYPGYENRARDNMQKRLRAKKLEAYISQIVIPINEEIRVKEKLVLPGFLLLIMKLTAKIWGIVRNTPGVTGFVGMCSAATPFHTDDWRQIPLSRFVWD